MKTVYDDKLNWTEDALEYLYEASKFLEDLGCRMIDDGFSYTDTAYILNDASHGALCYRILKDKSNIVKAQFEHND